MATQNLSAYDAVLKNVYRGTIVELLNQETWLIDQLEKTNANDLGTFTGRQLIFAVHASRNRGRQAVTDGGQLPGAGKQGYLDGIVAIKYFAQPIELSDQVIRQSETDSGAFEKAMTSEMDGASTDLRKDISRMSYGTGDGLLATVNANSTTTTFQVDSGQYIAVGDTIDILVKSSGATIANGTQVVTAVTYNGTAASSTQAQATVTVASGVTVTSTTHGVYISGDRNNESDGLRNITGTSRTLHSIDSSVNPVWDGNVKDLSYATGSEDSYMQIAQTIRQRSGKNIDLFLTSMGVQRRLANTYASQKRWNDEKAVEIDGGYSAIMVAAGNRPTPVVSDVDCVAGTVFALNKESFAWAELMKPDWLMAPDGRGSIFEKKDATTAGSKMLIWQAWMCWYSTLVCVAPNRNGKIINAADDVPITRL